MKVICSFFIIILFSTYGWGYDGASESAYLFEAKKDTIWVRYGPDARPEPMVLTTLEDTVDWVIYYEFLYDGNPQDIVFITEDDTLLVPHGDKPIEVVFRFGQDTHLLRIYYAGQEKEASYTKEYVEKNTNRVIVEIPEVYELANIAIAITNYGLNNPNRVIKEGEYYQQVLEHFLPFKNHPLISMIEFSDEKLGDYFSFRDNSACYVFEGDSIIPEGIYSNVRVPDLFEKHISLVVDFAEASQFRKFHSDNMIYYRDQIEKYKRRVPVRKMWIWLEKNFPTRYNCYKIIFSPLIKYSHETTRFKDDHFRETMMFIAGPELYGEKYSGKVEEGLLSLIVFTEIDHNYVNPITERYMEQINRAFSDVEKWNKGRGGYHSPYAIFNEYMTWAVFTLYAYDTYGREDFEAINQKLVDSMVDGRGFVRFKEFTDKLLQLYLNRKEEETIPDLYPKILIWVEKL